MGAPSVIEQKPEDRPTGGAERDLSPRAERDSSPRAERDLSSRAERDKRQRMRSIAIAVALVVMAVLFYAATIVRLGGHALNRPM